jgi:hypothetical protein
MGRVKVLVFTVLLASCNSPTEPSGNEPLTLTRLRADASPYSYNSALVQSQRLVIRDQAAWQQAWTTMWVITNRPPALPTIDFSREMVIVAALGERPTGGYGIFLDGATESATGVTINVRTVSPGNGCAVTLALTRPVDIARVTRRDGNVSFAELSSVQHCN